MIVRSVAVLGLIAALALGACKPRPSGRGVIVDADGRKLEVIPPERPAGAEALKTVADLSRKPLPVFDDPQAGLQTRKRRAQGLLLGSALLALALAYWARRWRPNV